MECRKSLFKKNIFSCWLLLAFYKLLSSCIVWSRAWFSSTFFLVAASSSSAKKRAAIKRSSTNELLKYHKPLFKGPWNWETARKRKKTRCKRGGKKLYCASMTERREEKKLSASGEKSHSKREASAGWTQLYKVFRSLRAWSSSSLIALYFSFWLYSSSARWWAERERDKSQDRSGGNTEMCRSGGGKREDSELHRLVQTGWRDFEEPYLLSHLWSSPALSRTSRRTRRGFPPVRRR